MPRFTWPGFVLALIAPLALAQAVAANPPTPEQSRAQSQAALGLLLGEGDRLGAMRAALLGLPASPTETDLAQYPEAMSALWRAYANRSVRAVWQDYTYAVISPDGTRMVLSRDISSPITPDAPYEVSIVDTLSGAPVGDMILSERPVEGGMLGAAALALAPAANLVAIGFDNDGLIHVHRLEDGARVASLRGQAAQMVLSPDGRYLATSAPQGLSNQPWAFLVREVATGAEVVRADLSPVHNFAWATETALLVGNFGDFSSAQTTFTLHLVDLQQGHRQIPISPSVPPGMIVVSPARTHFMVMGGPDVLVFDMDGQHVLTVPAPGGGGAHFVRGGSAVAVLREGTAQRLVDVTQDVYALDGTPLAPEPADYTLFDTLIFSPGGEVIGTAAATELLGAGFVPVGTREGLDLIAAARAEVGGQAVAALPEIDPQGSRSDDFAKAADARLQTGDRTGAIVAALKGLPDDPSPADFDRFALAHEVLFRAVAARVLRIDADEYLPVAVSSQGDRQAHGGSAPALYGMPSGQPVAPLRRADGSVYAGADPHFDPTGKLVAMPELGLPVLHFHDARTGAHVARLEFPITSLSDYDGYSTILQPVGFSHDGTAFAVGTHHHIFLVDMADLSVRQSDPPGRNVGLMAWLPGRNLLLVDPVYSEGPGPVADVHIFDGTGATRVLTLQSSDDALRSAPLTVALNRQGSLMLTAEGDSTDGRAVVYDGAGQVRATLTGHDGILQFVRDGMAIAYRDESAALGDDLRVMSLETGSDLPVVFQDHVGFDEGLFNLRGEPITWGEVSPGGLRYSGADVPTGRALWEQAMEAVGEAARAEIAAERIGVSQ